MFYAKLFENDEYVYKNVKRWTKRRKLDVSSLDIILVPIHVSNMHWALAILDTQKKKAQYFDSLGHSNETCLDNLVRWYQDEMRDKHGVEVDPGTWIKETPKDIPLQQNTCDCGMYVLLYMVKYGGYNPDLEWDETNIAYFRRRTLLDIVLYEK